MDFTEHLVGPVSLWSWPHLQLLKLLCEYLQELIKVDFPESGQVRPADHGIGQLLSKRLDSCRGHSLPPLQTGHRDKSSPTSRLFPGKDQTYFPHILHKHVDKTFTAVWQKGSDPGRDFFNSKGTLANSDRVRHHGYAQPTAVVLCCHAMLLIPQSPDAKTDTLAASHHPPKLPSWWETRRGACSVPIWWFLLVQELFWVEDQPQISIRVRGRKVQNLCSWQRHDLSL
jgi:hypothetical protein